MREEGRPEIERNLLAFARWQEENPHGAILYSEEGKPYSASDILENVDGPLWEKIVEAYRIDLEGRKAPHPSKRISS